MIRLPKFPLFVPGHRADMIPKAAASGADMVIFDLEDAVADADKDVARSSVGQIGSQPVPVAVRVNTPSSPWFAYDLDAINSSQISMVVLPKTENRLDLDRVSEAVGRDIPIMPIIETACGLHAVSDLLAHPSVELVSFGHLDFSLDIGASSDWENLLFVRSQLVLQSRLADAAPPLDGVTVSFDDPNFVSAEARRARDLGFGGKLLIHPRQVAPAKAVFQPSEEDYKWALLVLDAVAESRSAVKLDGAMIDMPVIKRAEQIKWDFEAME